MIPRKPLAPNNGVMRRSLNSEFAYQPDFPKSIEKPSIVAWASRGRGVQGEHDNGGKSAIETWRNLYARRKPWGMR